MIVVKASLVLFPFCCAVNTNQSIKAPSFVMLKWCYFLLGQLMPEWAHSSSRWLNRPSQTTTSCLRSCNLRPRPWSARRRARPQQHSTGGYFLTLPPTCVVSAKQLFSFYCKSAHKGCASIDQRGLSGLRAAHTDAELTKHNNHIYHTGKDPIHDFIYPIGAKVRKWRVCVRVSRTKRSGRGCSAPSDQSEGSGVGETADQWVRRAEAAEKVRPVAEQDCRSEPDPSSRPTLTSGCTEPAQSPLQPRQTPPFRKAPPLVL